MHKETVVIYTCMILTVHLLVEMANSVGCTVHVKKKGKSVPLQARGSQRVPGS